ncbi:hypothetical protein V8C34DRAFT_36257 [Trichoderma compactum]
MERDGLDGSLVLLRESVICFSHFIFFFFSSTTFLHHGLRFFDESGRVLSGYCLTNRYAICPMFYFIFFHHQFLNMLPMHNTLRTKIDQIPLRKSIQGNKDRHDCFFSRVQSQ